MRSWESMTTALIVVEPASMPSQQRPSASSRLALGMTSRLWRAINSSRSSGVAKSGSMRGDSTCTGAAARRSMRVVSFSPRVSDGVAPASSA